MFVLALFLNEAEAVRYRPYTNGDTPWYKQELKEPEDEFPVDYPVIDRGMDQDAISTLDVIGKTEKKLKHQINTELWTPPKPPPMDYFVPDFGQDEDIATTLKNGSDAEYSTGHTFSGATFKKPKDPPRDYFVPNFGPDEDITVS